MLDLPIQGVIIAVALSLLIGAAGGFVYAGIMGYRRKSKAETSKSD
jgi:PII-like signaling protein